MFLAWLHPLAVCRYAVTRGTFSLISQVWEEGDVHGERGHIPTQRDRKLQRSVAPAIYRQRNLVERFFNKLKHLRKIATRYEKSTRSYLAAILIASSRLWVR